MSHRATWTAPAAAISVGSLVIALANGSCGRRDRRPSSQILSVVSTTAGGGADGQLSSPSTSVGLGSGSGSGGPKNDQKVIPDPDAPCDAGLAIDENDPLLAAAALGICKAADPEADDSWGLVSARWSMIDGSVPLDVAPFHLGHGILPGFGNEIVPFEGDRVLVLSSGTARQPGDPGFSTPESFDKKYTSMPPLGFPKESPACPGVLTGATHDDIALEIELRPPPDAKSIAFDFNFYTWEWPVYVCSQYNDFFVALLEPFPIKQTDGNISFDSEGNPVSVNNGLVRVCTCNSGPPCDAPPVNPLKSYDCELGASQLTGTGFEDHAATGWLRTVSPLGSTDTITLRFGVYDSGDGLLDSLVVLDNFVWLGDPIDDPGTKPK